MRPLPGDTVLTLTSPVRWLTNRVLAARVEQLFRGTAPSSKAGLGSRLLFSRLRRQMGESELHIDGTQSCYLCPAGGSVRLMVVGSAPVAPGILTFIRAALGT